MRYNPKWVILLTPELDARVAGLQDADRQARTLQAAAKQLAECQHPEDQRRCARTKAFAHDNGTVPARDFIRCVDCGAVSYEGEPGRWTRPMLVAHVVGALGHSS